ncbi:MAG TPA: anti-phage protein KwaB [Erysipelotrichaceae bacterium]|nr:anti-phage protein KwaB [Erysipelotrichaceae bacterium]
MEIIENKIKNSLDGLVVAKLYFLLQDKDRENLIIRQVNLDNKTTQPHLTELVKEALNSTFIENKELSVRNLDEADDRKNIIYKDDKNLLLESLNFFLPICDDITNIESINNFDKYNIKKDGDKKIFGYVIVIGNSNEQLMYFTKHYEVSTFSTEQFILVPKFNVDKKEEELFTKVDSDLVRVSKKIDVLFIENQIYIHNLEMLESFFKFNEVVKKEASVTIETIESMGLLADCNKLNEMKDKNTIARKLARVSKNSQVLNLLNENKISHKDVLIFVENNAEYFNIKIENDKLIVETDKEVNSFLKLLDDPLLMSELTQLTYESTNKDLIK